MCTQKFFIFLSIRTLSNDFQMVIFIRKPVIKASDMPELAILSNGDFYFDSPNHYSWLLNEIAHWVTFYILLHLHLSLKTKNLIF